MQKHPKNTTLKRQLNSQEQNVLQMSLMWPALSNHHSRDGPFSISTRPSKIFEWGKNLHEAEKIRAINKFYLEKCGDSFDRFVTGRKFWDCSGREVLEIMQIRISLTPFCLPKVKWNKNLQKESWILLSSTQFLKRILLLSIFHFIVMCKR